jgi:hypothetical protein
MTEGQGERIVSRYNNACSAVRRINQKRASLDKKRILLATEVFVPERYLSDVQIRKRARLGALPDGGYKRKTALAERRRGDVARGQQAGVSDVCVEKILLRSEERHINVFALRAKWERWKTQVEGIRRCYYTHLPVCDETYEELIKMFVTTVDEFIGFEVECKMALAPVCSQAELEHGLQLTRENHRDLAQVALSDRVFLHIEYNKACRHVLHLCSADAVLSKLVPGLITHETILPKQFLPLRALMVGRNFHLMPDGTVMVSYTTADFPCQTLAERVLSYDRLVRRIVFIIKPLEAVIEDHRPAMQRMAQKDIHRAGQFLITCKNIEIRTWGGFLNLFSSWEDVVDEKSGIFDAESLMTLVRPTSQSDISANFTAAVERSNRLGNTGTYTYSTGATICNLLVSHINTEDAQWASGNMQWAADSCLATQSVTSNARSCRRSTPLILACASAALSDRSNLCAALLLLFLACIQEWIWDLFRYGCDPTPTIVTIIFTVYCTASAAFFLSTTVIRWLILCRTLALWLFSTCRALLPTKTLVLDSGLMEIINLEPTLKSSFVMLQTDD